jgi:hypothetical protein
MNKKQQELYDALVRQDEKSAKRQLNSAIRSKQRALYDVAKEIGETGDVEALRVFCEITSKDDSVLKGAYHGAWRGLQLEIIKLLDRSRVENLSMFDIIFFRSALEKSRFDICEYFHDEGKVGASSMDGAVCLAETLVDFSGKGTLQQVRFLVGLCYYDTVTLDHAVSASATSGNVDITMFLVSVGASEEVARNFGDTEIQHALDKKSLHDRLNSEICNQPISLSGGPLNIRGVESKHAKPVGRLKL